MSVLPEVFPQHDALLAAVRSMCGDCHKGYENQKGGQYVAEIMHSIGASM
ncbi:hypothetical protein DSM101010T_07060 [Desulfovibrio subterraneus]|uniref:Cytochrome C n=1 Tax=Desulfovibrio subterraneus TaxID=2718620 RepID=A0A7J0BGL8_9BACT|nr:hypothetical protein DSM101010T_07060 [Desulfovibrio subterraneus]